MISKTIPELLLNLKNKYGNSKPALRYKKNDEWIGLTHHDLAEQTESLFLGLCELGFHRNDRIGIVSENRFEWIIADLATASLGAVDVPLFPTSTPKQIEYIFQNCDVSAVFVSGNFQLNKILHVKDNIPSLRHIVVMDEEYSSNDLMVKSFHKLIARGEELKAEPRRKGYFEETISKIKPDDLLTLIYTSGTTGEPKGVMLTHDNVISNVYGALAHIDIRDTDHVLSYLPLNHSYERTTGYYTIFAVGATISLAESVETVGSNIAEVRPTIMTTVPRLLETIRKKILHNMTKENASKRAVFNWAVKIGEKYVLALETGKAGIILKNKYKIADKLVFSKIREKLGGNFRFFVSGGAPINEKVQLFFHATGILTIQGYGLTEASPVVSATNTIDNEIGTIGKPLPNLEVKLAEDGEILVKGPNVMKGYWNDPVATREAIDEQGWLYTGDVAVMTDRGNIRITDRKKHIFVNSGGKNIAPQPIENLLATSRYIEQVILIGDRRDYNTALITPDFEQLEILAEEINIQYTDPANLILDKKIVKHFRDELDYLQKDLSNYERVRKFRLLSMPFTIESGELSHKMSVKRHVVERKYANFIDEMYGVNE